MDLRLVIGRLGLTYQGQDPCSDFSSYAAMVDSWRGGTIPTETVCLAEWNAYEAEEAAIQYRKDRAAAYNPIPDQLDMMFWDKENGTELWLEHIREVKEAYKIPEEYAYKRPGEYD